MYAEETNNTDDEQASAPRRHSGPRRPRQSPLARRRRLNRMIRDLAREAGIGTPSIAERAALAQAAGLTLLGDDLRAAIVRGEPVDGGELVRLSGELRRALGRLRKRADAKPPQSLREYLANRPPKPADASGEPGA